MTPKKRLPNSEQCEKGLLASFLHSPDKIGDLCHFRGVTSKWFLDDYRSRFYTGLMEMREKRESIDLLTSSQYFMDHAARLGLDPERVQEVITEIFGFIGNGANAAYYVDQLQKKAAARLGAVAAEKLHSDLLKANDLQEVSDLVSKAFVEVKEICTVSDAKNWRKDELLDFVDEIDQLAAGKKPECYPFFIPSIDEEVTGSKNGEMTVIIGLTSTGKSLLGGHIIQGNVFEKDKKAAVFSMEMPTRQYLKRITASIGNISLSSMRDGKFTKQEFASFTTAFAKIEQAPLEIYDVKRNKMTGASIEAEIRKRKKNHGLDMVLIDHLGLIKFPNANSEKRRDQELSHFADSMKLLAQELDLSIILLAQANEKGTVFDSTQVESAADFIFALTPTYKTVAGVKKVDGTDGIWISKMREGRRGWKVPLKMEGKYAKIYEPTQP